MIRYGGNVGHRPPLAVVAAVEDEIRLLRARMVTAASYRVGAALVVAGAFHQTPVLLVRTGMGRRAVELALPPVLDRHRPALGLNLGYSGGAIPGLQPGDLIIASAVVDARLGARDDAAPALVARAEEVRREMGLPGQCGPVVTVAAAVHAPPAKAALHREHDAIAIDMESAAVAQACAAAGIPYLVVRAILDPLDYHLPAPPGAPPGGGGPPGFGGPRRGPNPLKLPPLKGFAASARRALAAFLEAWVRAAAAPPEDH